jgi:V/A-type H+/Na+-transporting ATPase subunit F
MNKHSIAIVGNKATILGFKGLGIETFDATNVEETIKILTELKAEKIGEGKDEKPKYAIIFVTENLMAEIPQENYKKLGGDALPAIIPVPSSKGSKNYGIKRIGKMVEKAVGSDIFHE